MLPCHLGFLTGLPFSAQVAQHVPYSRLGPLGGCVCPSGSLSRSETRHYEHHELLQEVEHGVDWLKAAPYMKPFVHCLAANRVLHYAHPSLASQVWLQLPRKVPSTLRSPSGSAPEFLARRQRCLSLEHARVWLSGSKASSHFRAAIDCAAHDLSSFCSEAGERLR